ncbi:MAG: DUF4139 domain-containing protein [Planctomycetota bacterium]|jgi:hypothetical protein
MKRLIPIIFCAAALAVVAGGNAPGANYNSEDITLVRETRSLSLKKGLNRVQYSWAGTLIDPTSVEIRPLEKGDEIEILDTTFPGAKPQHLIWNIDSKVEDEVKFQVTYFTSGITWSADYVLIADKGEENLSLDGYVRIINNSGEDYENAQVRLVVGVVNLVEKIADLARRGLVSPEVLRETARAEDAKAARRMAMETAVHAAERYEGGFRAPEIIKEGLSEYFIYTIEGTQTVPHQWSKRMISFQAREVDFDILYRLRPHQYGPRPVRFFILKNDKEHKLGTTPLPDGLVRTFRDNGRELNVGTDDEVVEEMTLVSVERSNFIFNRRRNVEGWDEERTVAEEIRNYRKKPIRMEVRRIIEGDVELDAEAARIHDFRTVEFAFDVKPREEFRWQYSYVQHLGRNAKQNAVRLR